MSLVFNMDRQFTPGESRIMQVVTAGFDLMESTSKSECELADSALRQAEVIATSYGLRDFALDYILYRMNGFLHLAESRELSGRNNRARRGDLIRKAEVIANFLGLDISERSNQIRGISTASEKEPDKVMPRESEFQKLVHEVESATE